MLRPMETQNDEAGTPPDTVLINQTPSNGSSDFTFDLSPPTAEEQQELVQAQLGDENDLRQLFQTSPTFNQAYSQLTTQVERLARDMGTEDIDSKNKLWDQIKFPSNVLSNIPLAGGYKSPESFMPYEYNVQSFNDLIRYPYQLNLADLQTLTNKLVYAGLLDKNNMPVGVFNAADPVFDTAWRSLIRNSIANGNSLSQELDTRIDQRLTAAQKQLTDTLPDQRAGMQSVALGLLGRELTDRELDEAMNLITARFNNTMTEEERFLSGQSGLPDQTMATQAIGVIAEEEIAREREGAGYLGLAQFDPRKNYGLTLEERTAFAGLQDNPFQNQETGMTNEQ